MQLLIEPAHVPLHASIKWISPCRGHAKTPAPVLALPLMLSLMRVDHALARRVYSRKTLKG